MPTTERLIEGIYDHLVEHVVLQDAEHRVLWLNEAAARSVGAPKEDLIGRACFEIWPARSEPCPECPVSEARKAGGVRRREMTTPDGRVWRITGIPIGEGKEADQAIEVTLEVTELREARRKLADRSEWLQSLFEDSRDPLYITTRSGRFVAVNQAMVDLFGYTRDELMTLTADELYADPRSRLRFQSSVERDGSVKDFPVLLAAKDGRKLDCLLTSSARRESEEVVGYQGIIRDVTRERLAARSIETALRGTITALGQTVEMRDSYTALHQRRVTELATRIATRIGLPDEQIECIRVAALTHDIGKLAIPAEILAKPSRLSEAEFKIVQRHPQTAYEVLSPIEFPWPVADIIQQHHERLDGSGYPSGLTGDAIDPRARILAVADVVEAMSAHRPYRPALGIERALDEIRAQRGSSFDGEVVTACIELFESGEFSFAQGA